MALSSKLIKTKIKAVGNVKKITKAMEKVSAVKMRKTVAATLAAREYAFHTYELLLSLLGSKVLRHKWFKHGKKGEKILLILVSANRGLSGGLNIGLGKSITAFVKENENIEVIPVGKKMERLARKLKLPVVSQFLTIPDSVTARDTLPLSRTIIKAFDSGEYKKVIIAYNHFRSALSFIPVIRQLFPLDRAEMEKVLHTLFKERMTHEQAIREYTIEPSEEDVLKFLLPKVIDIKIYKILLESRACEHSARMVAMKNATDNAQNLIDDLVVGYNQARQASITREISEIAAGAGAINY